MKKQMIIMALTLIFLFALSIFVYAAEPQITITGDDKITAGGTKELIVAISADEDIGLVSGVLSKTDTITKINVVAENDWSLTYNKNTGAFNILKAEGASKETIMKITYTVEDSEGVGTIKLENLKLTTIDYNEISKGSITKNIVIEKENGSNDETTKPDDGATKPGDETTKPGDETTKPDGETTKPDDGEAKDPTVKDQEKQPDKIPPAGIEIKTLIILAISTLVAVGSYFSYKKYKNI